MAATERALDWTKRAAQAASDKKATDIVAIDVSEKLAITDVFLILTGSNDRQVKAISDAVEEALDLIDVMIGGGRLDKGRETKGLLSFFKDAAWRDGAVVDRDADGAGARPGDRRHDR